MKLYISFLSVLALVVLYLPLATWVIWRLIRRSGYQGFRAATLGAACLAIAAAIPLADVVIHSRNMAKACQQAGLHIYRKVQVDGYYDPDQSQEVLSRHAYRFIEYGARYVQVYRVERQVDGSFVKFRLKEPTAEYEIDYESNTTDSGRGVNRLRWWAKNRITGDVIGEYLGFSPYYGWVDRYLVQRWFGTIGGDTCMGSTELTGTWRADLLPPRE